MKKVARCPFRQPVARGSHAEANAAKLQPVDVGRGGDVTDCRAGDLPVGVVPVVKKRGDCSSDGGASGRCGASDRPPSAKSAACMSQPSDTTSEITEGQHPLVGTDALLHPLTAAAAVDRSAHPFSPRCTCAKPPVDKPSSRNIIVPVTLNRKGDVAHLCSRTSR